MSLKLLNFVNNFKFNNIFHSHTVELFKIKCNLAYNQIKNIMKNSNIQKRKFTKNELKEINGGAARPVCPRVISCTDPRTGEELSGVPGIQDGYCC